MNGKAIRALTVLGLLSFSIIGCGGEDPDHSNVVEDQYDQMIQEQAQQDWAIEQDAARLEEWAATQNAEYHLENERIDSYMEESDSP